MDRKPCFNKDYKLVEDSSFFGTETFYILCNEKYSKYISIPNKKIDYILFIIELMDGTRTILEIQEEVRKQKGYIIDISKIEKLFLNNGFIEGSSKNIEKNEIDIMSKELASIKFKPASDKTYFICKRIKQFFLCLYIVVFIFGIINICVHLEYFLNAEIKLTEYKKSAALGFYICLFSMYISLFLHELSHVIVALSYKKDIDKISFNLYAGCLPMIYVKIKGANSLKVKKRLQVIAAGIVTNLFLAVFMLSLACSNILNYELSELMKIIGFSNFYAAIMNMIPSSLSDGYFILSILLNKYDMRKYVIKYMFSKNNDYKMSRRERFIYRFYAFISIISLIYILVSFGTWSIRSMRETNNCFAKIVVGVILFIVLFSTIQTGKNLIHIRERRID